MNCPTCEELKFAFITAQMAKTWRLLDGKVAAEIRKHLEELDREEIEALSAFINHKTEHK
jgi:hypothetical protein